MTGKAITVNVNNATAENPDPPLVIGLFGRIGRSIRLPQLRGDVAADHLEIHQPDQEADGSPDHARR